MGAGGAHDAASYDPARHDPKRPWRAWIGGVPYGRYSSRATAIRAVDASRLDRYRSAEVRHTGTGEQWLRHGGRRGGVWFKNAEGSGRRKVTTSGTEQFADRRNVTGGGERLTETSSGLFCPGAKPEVS